MQSSSIMGPQLERFNTLKMSGPKNGKSPQQLISNGCLMIRFPKFFDETRREPKTFPEPPLVSGHKR